jgi:hypothetical protein
MYFFPWLISIYICCVHKTSQLIQQIIDHKTVQFHYFGFMFWFLDQNPLQLLERIVIRQDRQGLWQTNALSQSFVLVTTHESKQTTRTICDAGWRRLPATDGVISLVGSCRRSCGVTSRPHSYCSIDSFICSECWYQWYRTLQNMWYCVMRTNENIPSDPVVWAKHRLWEEWQYSNDTCSDN